MSSNSIGNTLNSNSIGGPVLSMNTIGNQNHVSHNSTIPQLPIVSGTIGATGSGWMNRNRNVKASFNLGASMTGQ